MNTCKGFIQNLFTITFIIAHVLAQDNIDFTKCAINNYQLFINGIVDVVETSDPLLVNSISANFPDYKYQLKNAQLKGMKGCTVTELMINKNKYSFEYNLACTLLEGNAEFDVKGQLVGLVLDGEGDVKFTCEDCLILLSGNYVKSVGKDNEEHVNVKNYDVSFNPRGKLTINLVNAFSGDKDKTDAVQKLLNDNWQIADDEHRRPVLRGFLDVFVGHLNVFLQQISINEGCVSE